MQKNFKSIYKTIVHAPVEKVWHALTDPEMVKQYFFGSDQLTDWKVGSPILFTGEYEGKAYRDKGVVLEYVENERLAFSYLSDWSNMPDEPENYLHIVYEVKAVDGGTALTIEQTNYDAERQAHSEQNWGVASARSIISASR